MIAKLAKVAGKELAPAPISHLSSNELDAEVSGGSIEVQDETRLANEIDSQREKSEDSKAGAEPALIDNPQPS